MTYVVIDVLLMHHSHLIPATGSEFWGSYQKVSCVKPASSYITIITRIQSHALTHSHEDKHLSLWQFQTKVAPSLFNYAVMQPNQSFQAKDKITLILNRRCSNFSVSLPFLQPSSSPLSISRQRGLSGKKGRIRSCRKAGTHVVESRIGQCSSLPSSSLLNHRCLVNILFSMTKKYNSTWQHCKTL